MKFLKTEAERTRWYAQCCRVMKWSEVEVVRNNRRIQTTDADVERRTGILRNKPCKYGTCEAGTERD
jgi:hypothetical protein